MKRKANRGFTLIELMITVAIVGILASIALPAYTDAVLKSRRAEGRTALLDLLQQQERYMTQRNTYLAFTTNTGTGATTPSGAPFKVFSGDSLGNSAYILSADQCPDGAGTIAINNCVRVIATPVKTDADANVLRITSTGSKDCTGNKSTVCWK